MSAERFLQWLLDHLCNGDLALGGLSLPRVDAQDVGKATDLLSMALELSRRDPAGLDQPQPTLGYTIGCVDCSSGPVGWTGIAFSRPGASALLQGHKAQVHHSHSTRRI